ncbi:MAG TPA: winged helix-turn-helix domain-containing protein [Pyrinomonadaceae bacterium]|nr:winged helix-turn-helix domain-containing protein [Pyrinomonadaceae bacterium]HMP66914.1 winged helix-turn-helix domain-containing protein [Pyrinomonadaceae bacterium]
MTSAKRPRLCFTVFEFDPDRLTLYFNGEPVKIERKALEVLAVLVNTAGEIVEVQKIIDEVWADNLIGVTPMHVAQSISKLRKTFSMYDPDTEYIETFRGSGYLFKQPVIDRQGEPNDRSKGLNEEAELGPTVRGQRANRRGMAYIYVSLAATMFAAVTLAGWKFYGNIDETAEIKRVLEASQKYESLVLYRDPRNIDEAKLNEYWLSEQEYGAEVDLRRIRAGADRLSRENKYYGAESRCEQFEIQSIEISKGGDFATAKTLEKWFLAEYHTDGTLVKNKTVGPYFVHYILRKDGGQWKIEKSSTARATKPPPIIEKIEFVTDPVAGREFFVRIEGQGIDPASVFIKVIGPGCPDVSPCSVPNSALRIHSKISETEISNAPFTLDSGEYTIYAQNGESTPSNSITLLVP